MKNITRAIAEFVEKVHFDEIPCDTVSRCKLAFLDWLGVTLAGSQEPSSVLFRNALGEFTGPPQATLIGCGTKTDILSAALLNGYFSHVLSVTVFPAIMALSEWRRIGGRDFITAFATGVEVESRIGAAVTPAHYDRGWHATATVGRFGAAAGAARLLRLDCKRIVNAMGTAGTQAGGLRQMFGTMCKPFHPGKAAADGLMAAVLAEKGFTSSDDIIGGPMGFSSVLSDDYHPARITDGLGETWEVDRIVFKRHASCYSTHSLIECALTLTERLRPVLNQIKSIHCQVAELAAGIAHIRSPRSGLEAKFCQPYCVALILAEGRAGEEQFSDAKLTDPLIQRMMSRTRVEGSPALAYGEAIIEVVLNNGRTFKAHNDMAGQALPLDQLSSTLVEKFSRLARAHSPDNRTADLIEAIMALDTLEDLNRIIELLPKAV